MVWRWGGRGFGGGAGGDWIGRLERRVWRRGRRVWRWGRGGLDREAGEEGLNMKTVWSGGGGEEGLEVGQGRIG